MNTAAAIGILLTILSGLAAEKETRGLTTAEVLAKATAEDWRTVDPQNTLYLELPAGRVVLEMAPEFAPNHVANIKTLVRENHFDGLAILRAQDNYVVQWGDPDAENAAKARTIRSAKKTLRAEFDRDIDPNMEFTQLPDGDVYAPEVGHWRGFPVARDPKTGKMWLTHCYGMVGAGRDNSPDSGGGTELYVVIGEAPRQLDRNVTLVGRVIQGMELLSTMPRGPGAMGFYTNPEQRTQVKSMRLAADVSARDRADVQVLRTDTPLFKQFVESRRNRREDWYVRPAGKIGLAGVAVPVRTPKSQ